jgi:hypothetical protein
MSLIAIPMKLTEAIEFVRNFHRHNKPPIGGLFAVGCSDGKQCVGVAIVSRPVARSLDDGVTVEVIRCCVIPQSPKGSCSYLYSRCWQAAKALGWSKLITYTLQTESGASLRGAGWKVIAELKGSTGKGWQSRPGREWQEVTGQSKFKWEIK